jgi:hypothetical protein
MENPDSNRVWLLLKYHPLGPGDPYEIANEITRIARVAELVTRLAAIPRQRARRTWSGTEQMKSLSKNAAVVAIALSLYAKPPSIKSSRAEAGNAQRPDMVSQEPERN